MLALSDRWMDGALPSEPVAPDGSAFATARLSGELCRWVVGLAIDGHRRGHEAEMRAPAMRMRGARRMNGASDCDDESRWRTVG